MCGNTSTPPAGDHPLAEGLCTYYVHTVSKYRTSHVCSIRDHIPADNLIHSLTVTKYNKYTIIYSRNN